MKIFRLFIFALLIIMLGAGCSKKAMLRKYYVLEVISRKDRRIPRFRKTLPFRVEVRDFRVAKAFEQTRIAVRSASNELDYYFYHHWAVRPPVAVADLVYRVLDRTRLFQQLSREYSIRTDYSISGHIHSIERIQKQEKTSAHMAGVFELFNTKGDLIVMRYEFDQTVDMPEDHSMNHFAAKISELLHQESEAFAKQIASYFDVEELPAQ